MAQMKTLFAICATVHLFDWPPNLKNPIDNCFTSLLLTSVAARLVCAYQFNFC